MSEKLLITTYEAIDTQKEDPFIRLLALKKNLAFIEEEMRARFEDSNYEPVKYLAFMEAALDLGFKDLANDVRDYVKKYSSLTWKYYLANNKSDMSGASNQDNR